jgi:hypothetical protein
MVPKGARNAFSAALVGIGVLALYNWVLAPHVGCLHAMQQWGSALQRVAEERDRICSTLDAKVSRWKALQGEAAELGQGVFTVEGARVFVRDLLPLVEATGCAVVLADFTGKGKAERRDEPNAPVALEASPLHLVASGTPDRVSALLQRLVDHRPRVWIDSCQCDFSEGQTEAVECSLVLTLYTIRQRQATL